VEQLQALWDKRRERGVLADEHKQSNYDFKWTRSAPDWTSWSSIAECFEAYRAALMEKANLGSGGMSALRMQGV
jgi:hypothetical protein